MSLNAEWEPHSFSYTGYSLSPKRVLPRNYQFNAPENNYVNELPFSNIKVNEPSSNQLSSSINAANIRRKFTPEEDVKLAKIIAIKGPRKWNQIALSLPGRTGRQCRDRFQNYLNPSLTNGPWTREEDLLLEEKVNEIGQHWNKIAKFFDGRSSNNVKNRWYTYICKQSKENYANSTGKNLKKNEQKRGYQLNDDDSSINYSDDDDFQIQKESYNYNNNLINKDMGMNEEKCSSNKLQNITGDSNTNNRYNVLISNSKSLKKRFFPPIFPPNDIYILPSNQGMFDFLNQEIENKLESIVL